jgi:hypothetical protein
MCKEDASVTSDISALAAGCSSSASACSAALASLKAPSIAADHCTAWLPLLPPRSASVSSLMIAAVAGTNFL